VSLIQPNCRDHRWNRIQNRSMFPMLKLSHYSFVTKTHWPSDVTKQMGLDCCCIDDEIRRTILSDSRFRLPRLDEISNPHPFAPGTCESSPSQPTQTRFFPQFNRSYKNFINMVKAGASNLYMRLRRVPLRENAQIVVHPQSYCRTSLSNIGPHCTQADFKRRIKLG